jgi:hypothetical protein
LPRQLLLIDHESIDTKQSSYKEATFVHSLVGEVSGIIGHLGVENFGADFRVSPMVQKSGSMPTGLESRHTHFQHIRASRSLPRF